MNAWLKSVPCKNKDVGLKVTMLEEIGDGPKEHFAMKWVHVEMDNLVEVFPKTQMFLVYFQKDWSYQIDMW